jgi:class 3 adenylate cyclase
VDSALEVRYAKTVDGGYVAYRALGSGPPDLVFMSGFGSLAGDAVWEMPAYVRYFRGLARFGRLLLFDVRGSGLSDPLGPSEQLTLERAALDLLAVLDDVGCDRAALVVNNLCGLLGVYFAASYPHRTAALVLDGCYARLPQAPDYPWGVPSDVLERALTRVPGGVDGSDPTANIEWLAPTVVRDDPEFVTAWNRVHRSVASPRAAVAIAEFVVYGDVRPALPAVQAPTLVMYRSRDRFAGKPHAAYLAEHIRDAKLVELPGEDNLCLVSAPEAALGEIEQFLTGSRRPPETDRVLSTVLFTDIVGSTQRAAELGDRRWRELLDAHDGAVRRQLERFRGREVNTVGDGFVATFDGPGRAVECAVAIRDAVRALGLELRAGLHTGEIEVRGDDIGGIGVHVAARIVGHAAGGEVLTSAAVPLLVAGSAMQFEDRGDHELKGVPGTWHLFSVVA